MQGGTSSWSGSRDAATDLTCGAGEGSSGHQCPASDPWTCCAEEPHSPRSCPSVCQPTPACSTPAEPSRCCNQALPPSEGRENRDATEKGFPQPVGSQAAFIPVCGTHHSARPRCQVKEPKHVRAPNSSSGGFTHIINKLIFEIWRRQWQQLFPGIAPFLDHTFPPRQCKRYETSITSAPAETWSPLRHHMGNTSWHQLP